VKRSRIAWLALLGFTLVAVASSAPTATTATSRYVKATPPTPSVIPGEHPRQLVILRGEIVDFYCYIEKGLKGPAHRECAVKCVAGDVCMGILTTDDQLYMISVNHLRAMTPLSFEGTPDPFDKCRHLISEKVDLTGYAMERKGQRIVEIVDVKKAG
jgi:hypothetical protein